MSVEKLVVLKQTDKFDPHGVSVERQYVDGNLRNVKVSFQDGSFFEIKKSGWDNIDMCVPKPKIKKEVWAITGKSIYAENCYMEFPDEESAKKYMADNADKMTLEKKEIWLDV
jgi:hypothetical protein